AAFGASHRGGMAAAFLRPFFDLVVIGSGVRSGHVRGPFPNERRRRQHGKAGQLQPVTTKLHRAGSGMGTLSMCYGTVMVARMVHGTERRVQPLRGRIVV